MTFLSPLFLVGAAAAAIPLLLHLLRRQPEVRVRFAAVKLLRNAPVEQAEKKHLRELLLLALRMAALFLLALAFARPFFSSGDIAASTGTTIVALDRSYSLSAPGRFERAKQLARDAIAAAPPTDLVGVVLFDETAEVAARPSGDRARAASAVDEAAAGFGNTSYRAALASAAQLLAGARGTVVVVTDLQESGWHTADRVTLPEHAAVAVVDVGPMPDNLAVVALQPAAGRVIATIRNSGAAARDAHVRLMLDDRAAGEATVSVAARATADVALPFSGTPETASVAIDDPGGLQADNVRFAMVAAAGRPKVLLLTAAGDLDRDAYYMKAALEASAGTAGSYEAAGIDAASLATWTADQLSSVAAVMVLSTRGLDRRGRELLAGYAQGGGGLLIAAGPEVDGDVIGEVTGSGSALQLSTLPAAKNVKRGLAPTDVRHPIFQRFASNTAALGLVEFRQVAGIGGERCRQLARFTTGEPALIDCPAGDGRVLVLASDLDNRWNDFPLHATFVPFVHEAVRYLSSTRVQADQFRVGAVPDGVPARPGFAALPTATPAPRRVAVNVDPAEAEPARLTPEAFQAPVARLKSDEAAPTRVAGADEEERQHLWQYLLAAMLIVLIVEGVVAARTA